MRIQNYFSQLQYDKSIITYIVAGDPNIETSLEVMHLLVEQGAGIVEVGIPFSDTFAEGKIIRQAHARAVAAGIGLAQVLELCVKFRQTNQHTSIVLMGYSNSISWFGYKEFASQAKIAGIDGLLLVDMPADRMDDELRSNLIAQDIDFIHLIAPTTSKERMKAILENASGFLYYIALRGVTGSDNLDIEAAKKDIDYLKKIAKIPVVVGFGIKDASSAKQLLNCADGIVIGSEIVRRMQLGLSDVVSFMRDL